ncbi:MAG: MMPL family transporter [Chloroflexi bacterium]|nr:MMPL family transporter [Chloroflexota bacterium]
MKLGLPIEQLANASARKPKRTLLFWIIAVVVGLLVANALLIPNLTTSFTVLNNPDSTKGNDLLEERLRGPRRANDIVIVSSATKTVDDPAYKAFVQDLEKKVKETHDHKPGDLVIAETVVSYYSTNNAGFVSKDKKTTIIPFQVAGDINDSSEPLKVLREKVTSKASTADFKVITTGEASLSEDFAVISEKDLQKGEGIGAPVAILILILVFGAVVAALIPLAIAVISILVALGVAGIFGAGFDLSIFIQNMIFMIGLAVGIDYCLFIVDRYREERAKGLDKHAAIAKSASTAGRAVFFSGLTVILALLGMLLVPSNAFISVGLGAISVVVVSIVASMTLLPAILSLLGDKIERLRVPFVHKAQAMTHEESVGGFWDKLSHGVMKAPVISLILAAGLLVAAAIPIFDLRTGDSGVSTFPPGIESGDGFRILQAEFGDSLPNPADIVIDGPADAQRTKDAIAKLTATLKGDPAFGVPKSVEVSPNKDFTLLSVPMTGDPSDTAMTNAIKRLRNDYIPEAFAGAPAKVYVTGNAAFNVDWFKVANDSAVPVLTFVLALSFVLLMLVFRSIVIPVKAILLNLLSVGAAYGILVLVFQKGVGHRFFGFSEAPVIQAWIPVFLFSVLFGLSMDYHVFLLSRIRERFKQTGDNTGSVAFGIRSTGRLITGAALIMVAVFGGFASGRMVALEQMGFGLAVAVLIDATIVRSILVPASMKLLGKWNWYFPAWLEWLPKVNVEGEHAPQAAGAAMPQTARK